MPSATNTVPQSVGNGPYNPNSPATLTPTKLPNQAGGALDTSLQKLAESASTRSTQSYSQPNDLEQVGVSVNPGGYYSATFSYLALYPTSKIPISYPSGSSDTSAIYESLTAPNGGCLGNFITYINSGSGIQGVYSVYNYCGSSPGVVFETAIDSNFISNYSSNDSDDVPVIGTEVMTRDLTPKSTSVWYSIVDGKDGPEVVAQATGVLSSRTTGFALWTSELQPQPCPNIPTMGAGLVELWDNQHNTWNDVTPQMTATTSTLSSPTSSYGCFNPQTTLGPITEFPIPNSGPSFQYSTDPSGMTLGPDGNMWFVESYATKFDYIGKITSSGQVTLYPMELQSDQPIAITTGKDGNLWFTIYNANGLKIGKMTTSGAITEYAIPSGSASLGDGDDGITAGPDGNVWFTEYDANKIGKITPSGVITEYQLAGVVNTIGKPPVTSQPMGIVTGPDGNLWFAQRLYTGQIGKITTSGTITEYTVTGIDAPQPFWITAGPHGNLWFTEQNGNAIGKITTNGAITQYPLPAQLSYPTEIAPGADGNLWFTEYYANKVGKITTSGTITEYPAPTLASYSFTVSNPNYHWLVAPTNNQSNPYAMAEGPGGTVWFTDFLANRIGKVTVP